MITPITISLEKSLDDAIHKMVKSRVDTLFVVDGNNILKGYLSVENITSERHRTSSVADAMDKDVFFVYNNSRLQDSVRRILRRNLKNIPVVDSDHRLVGLITRAHIVDIVYDTIWGDEAAEEVRNEASNE